MVGTTPTYLEIHQSSGVARALQRSMPEVDANFVLYEGEIVFYELIDSLPCTAETAHSTTGPGNFLETGEIWSSNHPQSKSSSCLATCWASYWSLPP